MTRALTNWLESYVQYAGVTEAPRIMHFWTGVSVIAGALRRRVWFDQKMFMWYPSFYIVFVADPGIINKSTTIDIGMELLKEVPGIKFSADSTTWQSLVEQFAGAYEEFYHKGGFYPMSPLTIISSEFGLLIDFRDVQMVNLLITLWDGRKGFEKKTKTSGNDSVNAPWINLISGTTPSWIQENMKESTIGGGFTSRCMFVFGETKEKLVPLLSKVKTDESLKGKLIADLEAISAMAGSFDITPSAEEWTTRWYEHLWTKVYQKSDPDYIKNYLSRKQTHLFKLAMVLSAARGDSYLIEREDLELANIMLSSTEEKFGNVFDRVGKSDDAAAIERFCEYVKSKGECPYKEAYRVVASSFPNYRNFEGAMLGILASGKIALDPKLNGDKWVRWVG